MVYLKNELKLETTNPEEIDIKDELFLNCMNWAVAEIFKRIGLANFKPVNVTYLGNIFFDGQVIHIPYIKLYISYI